MQRQFGGDRLVYNISHGKTLPEWMKEGKSKRALKNDDEFQQRLELVQDFQFPTACTRIRMTRDKHFFYGAGVYRPSLRVWDTEQLSLKFEHHADCEIVEVLALSDDWTKMALLEADRSVAFHNKNGIHYTARIPKTGRDMVYDSASCDLYVAAASSDVYRLNLEHGRFMASLTSRLDTVATAAIAEAHHMLAFGGTDGVVECFDPRSRRAIGSVSAALHSGVGRAGCEVSKLAFDPKGLCLGVGTSLGSVLLYDLRCDRPVVVKDHRNDSPIVGIAFHGDASGVMITADRTVVKIWERSDGRVTANIEPPASVNDLCLPDADGGLLVVACEQPRIQAYYVPSLGLAPRWCSFLDALTEEMEQQKLQTVYDDYKFITEEEIQRLGIGKLIGTKCLRAYMHGYFIDIRLYNRVLQIENPFLYEEYRKQKIQEKIKQQLENRIALKPKKKQAPRTEQAPVDERFKAMVEKPELFGFDEQDPDFQRVKMNKKKTAPTPDDNDSDDSGSSVSDDDIDSDDDDDDDDDDDGRDEVDDELALYELDPVSLNQLEQPIHERTPAKKTDHNGKRMLVPLESRVGATDDRAASSSSSRTGNMQMSFVAPSKKKTAEKPARFADDEDRKVRRAPKPWDGGGRGRGSSRGGRGRGRGRK